MILNNLLDWLPRDEHVLITGHIHPDGDCIGSTLALSQLLKAMGYTTSVVLEERIETYAFLPGFDEIINYIEFEQHKEKLLQSAFSCVVMDSGDISRIEPMRSIFEKASTTINIDHHASNTLFGMHNIVDVKASSTCELLGIVIGLEQLNSMFLTKKIATCLYTGIVYDTGVFKHTNTRKETHLVASCLVNMGIDFNFIIHHLYFRRSKNSVIANKIALENLEFNDELSAVITVISNKDLFDNNLVKSDTEMIVSMLNEIEDTLVSVFFLEVRPQEFKASFRSSSLYNVCEVAKQFEGGGHIKAAGCTVYGSYSQVKQRVLKELQSEYKRNY